MDYITEALRTEAPIKESVRSNLNTQARLIHVILGLCSEVGEFADQLKRHIYYGTQLDDTNLMEELGDIDWYQAIAADDLGYSLQEIQERNIAKLKKRFPDAFKEEDAVERDLDSERKELEEYNPAYYKDRETLDRALTEAERQQRILRHQTPPTSTDSQFCLEGKEYTKDDPDEHGRFDQRFTIIFDHRGHCQCTQADACPLGKPGATPRCKLVDLLPSEGEIVNAQTERAQVVKDGVDLNALCEHVQETNPGMVPVFMKPVRKIDPTPIEQYTGQACNRSGCSGLIKWKHTDDGVKKVCEACNVTFPAQ